MYFYLLVFFALSRARIFYLAISNFATILPHHFDTFQLQGTITLTNFIICIEKEKSRIFRGVKREI